MPEGCAVACISIVIILLLTGISIGTVAIAKSRVLVEPGEVGIVVTRGNLRAVGPGRHKVSPFASKVTYLSTRTMLLEQSHLIPTKEGLSVRLQTTVQYHLDKESADDVYRDVGKDYASRLVAPAASSIIRSLTAEVEAKALYTSGRDEIQQSMNDALKDELQDSGIIIEQVYLQGVVLPAQLQNSIEQKAQAEQDNERMKFQLEQEQLEAERKAIEAQGIADFQSIVSIEISDQLLKWKAIEATVQLAKSDNAKIVVMGNGKNDLPVLLNGEGGDDNGQVGDTEAVDDDGEGQHNNSTSVEP